MLLFLIVFLAIEIYRRIFVADLGDVFGPSIFVKRVQQLN